jgi:hypothetical protein
LRYLAIIAIASVAGCAFQFLEDGPYLETFAVAGRKSVEIKGVDGDVHVAGSSIADEVLIRGTRRALGSTPERARENLDRVALDSRYEGLDLVLEFNPPPEMVGLLELELGGPSVFPSDLGLTVEVDDGDLTATDLGGDIHLSTKDGDVSILGAGPGSVRAVTKSGNATVEALGPVAIESNGRASLSVPDVDSSSADITTAGGKVLIEIVPQAMEIIIHADGGDVTVDPLLALESVSDGNGGQYLQTDSDDFEGSWKRIEITSHGGDIEINSLSSTQIP